MEAPNVNSIALTVQRNIPTWSITRPLSSSITPNHGRLLLLGCCHLLSAAECLQLVCRRPSGLNGDRAAEAVVQKFVISVQYTWVWFTGHRKIDVLMASLSLAGAEAGHKTFHDSRRSLPMPIAMKTVPQVIKMSATLNEYGLLIPQQLILR